MPDGACMTVDVQFNLCATDTMGRSLCTSTNEQQRAALRRTPHLQSTLPRRKLPAVAARCKSRV
jgi:hypothetical protein